MNRGSIQGRTGGLISPLLETSVLPELLPPDEPPSDALAARAVPAANPNFSKSRLFIFLSSM